MEDIIHVGHGLVLEACPDGPHILLRREGEPGAVRIFLNEVRYLADAMCARAESFCARTSGTEAFTGAATTFGDR